MLSFDTDGAFQDNYKFLIGSILPRPIAWISSVNDDGSHNIAPFSFFTAISAKPMIVAFCPLIRTSTGEEKDTARNIKKNKDFVINIFSENLAEKVNLTSAELPYGENEFAHANLETLNSEKVKAKRVKGCPIHFECQFRDFLSYGDTPGAGQIITGEVMKVHVDESVYEEGRIITQKLRPVGRGAGNDWFKCSDTFQLERLMKAQIQK